MSLLRFSHPGLEECGTDASRSRTDQLMLQDDPNFLPDFDLMPIDLGRLDFDMTTTDDSQRSTLSPHSSQLTGGGIGSQQDIGGLVIPPSASSLLGGPLGGGGDFSVRGDSLARTRLDARGGLDDDLGLLIDDDGNIFQGEAPSRQAPGPSVRGERTEFGSASSRVRREHEEGRLVRDMVRLCFALDIRAVLITRTVRPAR